MGSVRKFGRAGGVRWNEAFTFADRLRAQVAPTDHWCLELLGVDPSRRGEGHAGRLLRPMLRRCDAEELPGYALATDSQRVALLEYFGFRVAAEMSPPGIALRWRAMLRQPLPERPG